MDQQPRRARDLGIVPGGLPTGPSNAITDVPGVTVGHSTIDDGSDLHTGVTAIAPPALPVPAAAFTGNGYGKLIGTTQLDELGELETPILLTATLSVFRVADALVGYLLDRDPELVTVNPVVGETNDAYLSDIRARPITAEHVVAALDGASSELPAEGCVGAGTGTVALGYKGGIGTSSRVVDVAGSEVTIGALVQSNLGGTLTVLGVPAPSSELLAEPVEQPPGNSCMIVVATDAPLDARQLGRLARRAVFAMGRVGASYSHGSGDYALAFATSTTGDRVDDRMLTPVFAGVLDAVEEALLNSLFMATTTTGFAGRRAYALPHDRLLRRLTR
jgi:D-aminopeptidase